MKNKFLAYICSFLFVCGVANAEVKFGASLMVGQADTSGHELEAGSSSDKNSKSIKETFVGGSIFVEAVGDNGLTIGLDYVPLDIELGSGKRTDPSGTTGRDSGTRSASADVVNLITLYTNIPVGTGGYYGLLGVHSATVETSETLPTSTYGNEDILGLQVGVGLRSGNAKFEFSYSDFEDITLNGVGGNSNKIEADADAMMFKIAYGF